jgi:hypothetical protein
MSLQITPAYLDLEYNAPDSSYKKVVRLATTADLAASTFSAGVITGYARAPAAISTTSTAASTTLTVGSTATVKTGAVISVASAFVPAGLTVTVASATTLTLSAATRVMTTTAASGSGTVATLTFAAQTYAPYAVGASIVVAGVTPADYNGTFTVTECTTTTVSYSSATTGAQTVAGTVTQTVAAGTANLTFINTIAALTIDSVATVLNDRVLVKDQRTVGGITDATAAKQNGIYRVTAIGSTTVAWSLARTQDADASTDLDSAIVNVSVGTANFGKTYKTRFAGTSTLNTTEMYWNRIVGVNSSSLAAVPTTAVGVHLGTDTETLMFKVGAVTDLAMNALGITTVQATGASTYTRASTLYIAGAPVASTNATITTPYSLYIAGGNTYLAGTLATGSTINGLTLSSTAVTSAAATALNVTTGTTGVLTLDSGSTGAVNLGNNANAKTVTIGNVTGATAVNINAGTGGVNIGSTLKVTGTAITAGTFNASATTPTLTTRLNYEGYLYPTYINLIGSADTAAAATHYFVETATDGYVRPKLLANVKTEIVTTAAVNSAAATTVGTVTSGIWNAGAVTSSGSITSATYTSTAALSLDSATTNALNIGTGANAKTITIGNSTGATAVAVNTGTGGITATMYTAATNTAAQVLTIDHQTSGTPAVGIGSAITFKTETAAANTEIGMIIEAVTTDVTAASEDFSFNVKLMTAGAAAATKFTVTSVGDATATGNVTAYSDERLKTNWRDFTCDFVTRLATVKSGTYDRIDCKLTQVGVSAQSLQLLMPHAIVTNSTGDLAVAYGNAAMVSAVELAKKIVEQEARIARLEALINTLID